MTPDEAAHEDGYRPMAYQIDEDGVKRLIQDFGARYLFLVWTIPYVHDLTQKSQCALLVSNN